MKQNLFLCIAIIIANIISDQVLANDPGTELKSLILHVKNIKHDKGKIYIAVFDREKAFMNDRFSDKAVPVISTDDLKVELKLPNGKYAISIFHDVNSNEKLNTNFIGIPKEPYGFSNNPKTTLGPPNFKQASFNLAYNIQEIEIILK